MGSGNTLTDNSAVADIARAFVEARRDRAVLRQYPGERPTDLTSAYAVQDCALAIWDRPVAGWKVGRINAPLDDELGANRLAGPIFADTVVKADAALPIMPIFRGGFAAGEAEFMLRLAPLAEGRALPQTDAETLEWIDTVRIGIEIASSPYPGINDDGPCVTISDHGNNAGLVLGLPVERAHWTKLNDIEIETMVDGKSVGLATAATMLDGPLGAVRFILANLAQRGIALQQGWWISTGAVTGVHPVQPGQQVVAKFSGIGEIACRVG